jgi:hypothetical protein
LVTSLDNEILTLGRLYRDRADCENNFDELKNQWGRCGFTTHDLKRCRLLAGCVVLAFNWWSLFVRLADPDQRPEAITSRPLLMQAIARQTRHAGQVTLTLSNTHTHNVRHLARTHSGDCLRLPGRRRPGRSAQGSGLQTCLWASAGKRRRPSLTTDNVTLGERSGSAHPDPANVRHGGFVVQELPAPTKVHHARYR